MSFKIYLACTIGLPVSASRCRAAFLAVLLLAPRLHAAVPPAAEDEVRRLLTLLAAVGEEYREGVRDGAVVRPLEFEEATTFLQDAQQRFDALAATLPGAGGDRQRSSPTAAATIQRKAPAETVDASSRRCAQRVVAVTGVSEQVYPPAAPSAARGKALFAEYCVTCHGERGDGKGPSAAGTQSAARELYRRQLHARRNAVRLLPRDQPRQDATRRCRRGMSVLSVQERWDLVSYLWTLAPGVAGIAEGQGVYLTQCASCHGATGNGQGTFAGVLVSGAADLSTPQALARKSDAELFAATTTGIAGTPMPSFARTLLDDERWKAVAFLRLLSHGGPGNTSSAGTGGAGDSTKRFSGLLRLLGGTYERAWSGGQLTNAAEYDEAAVLAHQIAATADTLATQIADAEGRAQVQAAAHTLDSQVRERAADGGRQRIDCASRFLGRSARGAAGRARRRGCTRCSGAQSRRRDAQRECTACGCCSGRVRARRAPGDVFGW